MPESGVWRWVHPQKRRWYILLLHRDLFGDWVLLRAWGGLDSRQGGEKKEIVASAEEAGVLIRKLSHHRDRHGYHKVTESPECLWPPDDAPPVLEEKRQKLDLKNKNSHHNPL